MRLATSLGAEDDNGAELFRRRTRPVGGTQAVPRGRQQPPRVGAAPPFADNVHHWALCAAPEGGDAAVGAFPILSVALRRDS